MEISLKEAQKSLRIDTKKLDFECQTQPELYAEIARKYVEAISIRDELKQDAENIWSTIFIAYKTGSDKAPSDTTVKAMTDIHEDYLGMYNAYMLAKKEADEWFSLKEAFQQKANMLKELCGLYIAGYFGEINVTMDRGKFEEKKYEEGRKKLRKDKENR